MFVLPGTRSEVEQDTQPWDRDTTEFVLSSGRFGESGLVVSRDSGVGCWLGLGIPVLWRR